MKKTRFSRKKGKKKKSSEPRARDRELEATYKVHLVHSLARAQQVGNDTVPGEGGDGRAEGGE